MASVLGQLADDQRTPLDLFQQTLNERLGMTVDAVAALGLDGMLPVTAGLLPRSVGPLVGAVNLHAAVGSVNALPLGERVT
ncbi:hypothetical protein [Streptomyces sp. NBC_00280]|uniref:hypothetical protein n=1 Tax=Streptomyces sp. NBC_00280 TaxID=2975699 RepID=UPI0032495114